MPGPLSMQDIYEKWKKMSIPAVLVPMSGKQIPLRYDLHDGVSEWDEYENLQPETATEMEVPCPRCGHRAAPEHITKLTGKHGYGCKCWSCQFTWEHNG